MKKVILAINDKKIIQKIKQNKEVEIINNVQYREGILEILDNEKNISNILIQRDIKTSTAYVLISTNLLC